MINVSLNELKLTAKRETLNTIKANRTQRTKTNNKPF